VERVEDLHEVVGGQLAEETRHLRVERVVERFHMAKHLTRAITDTSLDWAHISSRQAKPRKGGNPTTLDRNLSSESRGLNSLPVEPNQQPEASLACEYGNVLLEA